MSPDELAMLKHDFYVMAMEKMCSDMDWAGLGGNCLPACRAIFEDVKERFPQARIMVGLVETNSGTSRCSMSDKRAILEFIQTEQPLKPDFHAWIDLDGRDFFDPVGPSWLSVTAVNNCNYLDASLAEERGVKYQSVLDAPEDVEEFYRRLLSLQRKTN
ncbi:MAG: hypothetical protein M0Z73_02980 [Betaproteobacteria bacterium]|nr:hypothetical protein [Betaproteobacteria bacterium]